MTTRLILAALALVSLAACGGSQRSSDGASTAFGRFMRGEEPVERLEPPPAVTTADSRVLVQSIDEILAEEVPGGVILWARGIPPYEGFYDSGLVQVETDSAERGTLFFEFRVRPPAGLGRVGTPRTREIIEAVFLSDAALEGVTQVTVIGQSNRRSTRQAVRR